MSPTARKIAAALLLLLGVQLWLIVGRSQWGNALAGLTLPVGGIRVRVSGLVVWAAVVVLALVPAVSRRVVRVLEQVARPSPRTRLVAAAAIALVVGLYLYATAVSQGREFILKILDENSYAIGARMLAAGRLWTAAHPAAESFDSAYVLVRPVYASMYFPGTALMLVPAVWLGLPWWVTPLLAFALSAGVLYRVVTELIDGVAGLLSVLLLASLTMYRELALRLYSQVPMLLLSLLLMWAWLAWRNDRRAWRAGIIGLLAGWMLIVRPLDALIFLLPVMVAMTLDLRRPDWRTAAAIAIGVAPFLVLQLVANRGVTGSWTTTPHAFYAQRDFPGVTLGFHEPRPAAALVTRTPQKHELYAESVPAIRNHRPAALWNEIVNMRLRKTALVTLPNNLLLILLPVGVAAVFASATATMTAGNRPHRRRTWVFAAALPLFLLAYALYLFYLPHYIIVIAPAVIFLVVLAVRALPPVWPRAANALTMFVTAAVVLICLYEVPQVNRHAYDDLPASDLVAINEALANLAHRPALVLFRYPATGGDPGREPVYNVDALHIDDAEVIRAHDLPGEINRRLLDYYAQRQPHRHVYRVIRKPAGGGAPELIDLGPVGEVASRAAREPL
jgi:hypothetical protein